MKSRIFTLSVSIVSCIALLVVIYSITAFRSEDALLEKMALLQPGMKLDSIRPKLGVQMQEFTNLDEMISRGTVKDRDFCSGKKLYWFPPGPIWSVLEVYTDQDDKIVYVTWQTL